MPEHSAAHATMEQEFLQRVPLNHVPGVTPNSVLCSQRKVIRSFLSFPVGTLPGCI